MHLLRAMSVAIALLLVATPAVASPPSQVDVAGDVFTCGEGEDEDEYTVTSGKLFVREEVTTTPTGDINVVFHLVARGLEATDQAGESFRIVGVATNVVHYDPLGSITNELFIVRMRILSENGGVAGVAHLAVHVSGGEARFTQSGTCTPPNTV